MKGFQVLVWVHRGLAVFCLGMAPICWMAVGQGEATVIFAGIATVALITLSGLLYWDSRTVINRRSN